ncbi:MAG: alpha/beta hydrolase family protein [Polyangiaceae bacterium]|nr:alpha/beta hydrolase family protein [Polyangiaceae bacterium]
MFARASRLVIAGAAASVDRLATLAAEGRARRSRGPRTAARLDHAGRMKALEAIAAAYSPEADLFRAPRAIDPVGRRVREDGDVRVADLSWRSDFEPFLPAVAERYLRHAENRIAAARLYSHREPRPVAVLIHGYLGGKYDLEQRIWPVEWLLRIGLDVALFVLPFHGVRARREGSLPPFPGSDPRVTNEGFRQAVGDLGDLAAWLRERGHPAVGAVGMSLGGYTTALAATVDPTLAFAVPMIPLASLADFARDRGRLGASSVERTAQHRALEHAHRAVSPLHRAPVVSTERMLVIGAEADRITPISHAR